MAASIAQIFGQLPCWSSDAVLLHRYVHERDEAAFTALVDRHGALVLRLCRRILGDAHAAEDAFQATFFILARKAHSLKQPDALPAWLYGVARRVALKGRTKSARPIKALDESLPDPHPDPLTQLSARELLDILDEEVQRLPVAQRSAFVLCCLEGHTQEEAARMLGWTAGSLKGRLERSRQRLQARLQRRGIALSAALALVVVARESVAARVPALLLQGTARAALDGGIGSSTAALADNVLRAMFWPKLAGVLAITLTLALAASTTIALVYRGSPEENLENNRSPVSVAPKDAGAGKPQVRTDALGDPLPPGAIARLGTVRFRHGGEISMLRFTPDGKRLVSQGEDGARVWDAATGKELRYLPTYNGQSDLSPDGKYIATASRAPSGLELWDVDSGKRIAILGKTCCAPIRFSPDGKLLAVLSSGNNVEIWQVENRKKLRSWNVPAKHVGSFTFSADSRRLLTNGFYDMVRVWDVTTGKELQDFLPLPSTSGQIPLPFAPALSPDGKFLALIEMNEKQRSPSGTVEQKARVSLRDMTNGKVVRQLTCPAYEVVPGQFLYFTDVAFAPDGKSILTTGPDAFVRIWDTDSGKELRRLPVEALPGSLSLSRDGKKVAVVMMQGTAIRILDIGSGQATTTPGGHLMRVLFAAFTPDGQTAVTGDPFGSLFAWDVADGQIRRRFDMPDCRLPWMQLSNDGRTLFTSGTDQTLRVWDVASGKEQRQMAVQSDPQKMAADEANRGLALTPDGKTLAVVNARNTIRILDAANGTERLHFQGPKRVLGMRLTPDSRTLIAWSGDYKVHVWNTASGRKLHEYPLIPDIPGIGIDGGHIIDSECNFALSHNGRLLAMGYSIDNNQLGLLTGSLILKDLATGQVVHHIDGLPRGTAAVAFSPDDRMLAWAGFYDPSILLLETAIGRERRRLTGHRGRITALAFSADGRRLLSGCNDTTALVWDLSSDGESVAAAELETLWSDLAGEDTARAYRAIHRLAASPSFAVPFLRKRLTPIAAVDAKRLARLIADLDSDDFAVREKATADLQKIDEQALPAYHKALESKPSLESRRRLEDLQVKAYAAWWHVSGERLRTLRAVEALERAGTSEAREVLQTLASGAEGARQTEEAKSALQRFATRAGN